MTRSGARRGASGRDLAELCGSGHGPRLGRSGAKGRGRRAHARAQRTRPHRSARCAGRGRRLADRLLRRRRARAAGCPSSCSTGSSRAPPRSSRFGSRPRPGVPRRLALTEPGHRVVLGHLASRPCSSLTQAGGGERGGTRAADPGGGARRPRRHGDVRGRGRDRHRAMTSAALNAPLAAVASHARPDRRASHWTRETPRAAPRSSRSWAVRWGGACGLVADARLRPCRPSSPAVCSRPGRSARRRHAPGRGRGHRRRARRAGVGSGRSRSCATTPSGHSAPSRSWSFASPTPRHSAPLDRAGTRRSSVSPLGPATAAILPLALLLPYARPREGDRVACSTESAPRRSWSGPASPSCSRSPRGPRASPVPRYRRDGETLGSTGTGGLGGVTGDLLGATAKPRPRPS